MVEVNVDGTAWLRGFPEIINAPAGKALKIPEEEMTEEKIVELIEASKDEELSEEPEDTCSGEYRAYGGSQRWFLNFWGKLAGCGSVSGSDLAAYYQIGISPDRMDGDVPVFEYRRWMQLQKEMFRFMRPGFRGFPHISMYVRKFTEYAAAHQVTVTSQICHAYDWENSDGAFYYVKESILSGNPLALLILNHKEAALDEETWHWMTITGFDEPGRRILISNYGNRQWLDAKLAFDPQPGNEVKLARFFIEERADGVPVKI